MNYSVWSKIDDVIKQMVFHKSNPMTLLVHGYSYARKDSEATSMNEMVLYSYSFDCVFFPLPAPGLRFTGSRKSVRFLRPPG